MSLKYALLGIIDTGNRPYSGYDIKKIFDSSMQFYWNATYTQIYRTLAQLHKAGLLHMEVIQQENYPNKKVYTITPQGREELVSWVGKPFEIQKYRNEMLVQITLAERLEDEQFVNRLEEYIHKVEDKLAVLKSDNVQGIMNRARTDRERFMWKSSLGKGVLTLETEIRWANQVLSDFKKRFVDQE
jgi:DNA-binding PadR family transcriptional regulator